MLDIDDTEDRVHGRQELALFHAINGGRCFQPIYIYEAIEVALVLCHVIRRISAHWPRVDIVVRDDSHYGRPEAMTCCERNRVG